MMIDCTGQSEVKYYYHFDGLSSVVALSNVNNQVVENYTYDVFGSPSATSSIGNRFMFTGREYDTETGLYYYRARYYNPEIGRFLQTDPLGYLANMNRYVYVDNNPVNWLDPYGLFKWYGNWGGPDWTGGQKTPYENLTPQEQKNLPKPHDNQDRCYKAHDLCYSANRVAKENCKKDNKSCNGDKPRPCDDIFNQNNQLCDAVLAQCLANLGQTNDPSNNWRAKVAKPVFRIRSLPLYWPW